MVLREPPRGQPGQGGRADGLGGSCGRLGDGCTGVPERESDLLALLCKRGCTWVSTVREGLGSTLEGASYKFLGHLAFWAFWVVLASAIGVNAQLWGLRLGGDTGCGSEEEPESFSRSLGDPI